MKRVLIYCVLLMSLTASNICADDNWEKLAYPDQSGAMTLQALSDDILLTGNGSCIMRSSDRGQSWHEVTVNGGWAHSIFDFEEAANGWILATTADGLFISVDRGQKWVLAEDVYMARQIKQAHNGDFFMASQTESGGRKLQVSVNNAQSWQDITPSGYGTDNLVLQALSAGGMLLSTGQALLLTTNSGQSWQEITVSGKSLRFNSISAGPDYYYGSSKIQGQAYELYRSPDGLNWEKISHSPTDMELNWIEANQYTGTLYGYSYGTGLLLSEDKGDSWQDYSQGLAANEYIYDICFCPAGMLMITSSANKLYTRQGKPGAVDDLEFQHKLLLSPNPCSEYINIDNIDVSAGEIKIDIYNTRGDKVIHQCISNNAHRVGINQLPVGLYYICIQSGNNMQCQTFVIER